MVYGWSDSRSKIMDAMEQILPRGTIVTYDEKRYVYRFRLSVTAIQEISWELVNKSNDNLKYILESSGYGMLQQLKFEVEKAIKEFEK